MPRNSKTYYEVIGKTVYRVTETKQETRQEAIAEAIEEAFDSISEAEVSITHNEEQVAILLGLFEMMMGKPHESVTGHIALDSEEEL